MERHDVIMTGIGGRGVLLASKLLAEAAFSKYKYVTWSPSYYTTMRGGSSQGTVIFSDEEIPSPVVDLVEVVVAIESSQLKDFATRVQPGGTILVEARGLKAKVERKDITVIDIPAMKMAQETGSIQAANFILLGAYIQLIKAIPAELVEQVLERRFAGNERGLSLNRNALREGVKLMKERDSFATSIR